jgi:FkbM family methyltransferase
LRATLNTLKFILGHPLNRGRPFSTVANFARWQMGTRIFPSAVAIPFVGDTRLLIARGMTGATSNIYCGLQEFEDMALALHALRPGDLFVDVGANIGSYSVIAAGVCGARAIAIEPVPSTFAHLIDNVRLNGIGELVTPRNIGVGRDRGELRFSDEFDCVNHVLAAGEDPASGISVSVEPLDSVLAAQSPTLIKIDVEGFETEVIAGAHDALRSQTLLAVILELNGSGARYGFDEDRLDGEMRNLGFAPFRYDPFDRSLSPLKRRNAVGNTLYVRDPAALSARTASAPLRTIHGREF